VIEPILTTQEPGTGRQIAYCNIKVSRDILLIIGFWREITIEIIQATEHKTQAKA